MPEQRFATAGEVAALAGVSRSAVSRTFTEGASVSAATRRKVMEAARALDYHVNHLARGLSQTASRPVCLVGSGLETPFNAALLSALMAALQRAGRAALLIDTSGTAEGSAAALTQALQYRASGVIFLSGSPPDALVHSCLAAGQQVILINRKGREVIAGPSHITIDYDRAMAAAAGMFARAGCRRVTVVASTTGTPSLEARARLFLERAAHEGLEATILPAGPATYATGAKAARLILGRDGRPDGVFCVTDLVACGFLDVARRDMGLIVPDELCVLGFDDIPQAAWHGYDLTTFRQPLDDIADLAAALVTGDRRRGNFHLTAVPHWRGTVRGHPDLPPPPFDGDGG